MGAIGRYTEWSKKAEEQGDADAQLSLGYMYYSGQGILQNYTEAFKWYRRAADQGLASAQFTLGVMYMKGQGVTQDFIQAHMWLNLSSASSVGDEQEKAATARDNLAAIMTIQKIGEAQRLARKWLEKRNKQ